MKLFDMNELLRTELQELKRFYVDNGWVDGLFQILFLLEDVKVGVYLQEDNGRKLKQLRNMLYWFGLHVSIRHGGYATKNKELYREWNKFFGFKLDAEKLLGYPNCCVAVHNSGFGGTITAVYLYTLIKEVRAGKKSKQHIRQF